MFFLLLTDRTCYRIISQQASKRANEQGRKEGRKEGRRKAEGKIENRLFNNLWNSVTYPLLADDKQLTDFRVDEYVMKQINKYLNEANKQILEWSK